MLLRSVFALVLVQELVLALVLIQCTIMTFNEFSAKKYISAPKKARICLTDERKGG